MSLHHRSTISSNDAPTVFDLMLNPTRPKILDSRVVTPSISDQTADAFLLLLAGTDTTAHTLVVAVFNILEQPTVLARLKAELRQIMPQPGTLPRLADLERSQFLVSRTPRLV